MNKFFDVVVAKEYTIKIAGKDEKRTAWNKVGRAWISGSGESVSFELFLIPGQRYVVQLKNREEKLSKGESDETASL
ncbi:MAG: hypothetical protein R3A80_09995 [Bdellovibrionota bacterium]